MQKAALGQSDEAVQGWLEASGIDHGRRVARSIDVDSGWERAAETVLGGYLQAVCVTDVTQALGNIDKFEAGTVTLLAADVGDDVDSAPAATTLATKVSKAPAALRGMLAAVRTADTLAEALDIRDRLSSDESVITPDGIWLSRNWLRVTRDKDRQAGILAREHAMRRLKNDLREQQARADSAKSLLRDGRTQLAQLEERRERLQNEGAKLMAAYAELKASLDAARYRFEVRSDTLGQRIPLRLTRR